MISSTASASKLGQSLAIGLLVLACIVIVLRTMFPTDDQIVRRSSVVFGGAAGILVTLYLFQHPSALEKYANELVVGLLGLLLAFLLFLRGRMER